MSLIPNIELYKTHKLKPANNCMVVKYTITEKMLSILAPITPQKVFNMTEAELKVYTDTYGAESFNPEWSFEEAVNTDVFKQILISRLQNSSMHQNCEVEEVSEKLKEEWGFLEGKNIYLTHNIVGIIQHFTEDCKSFYATLIVPEKFNKFSFPFMAYYTQDKKYTPVNNYIEVCFEIPPELGFKEIDGLKIKGEYVPNKFENPDDFTIQDFKQMAREVQDMFTISTNAVVAGVAEKSLFNKGDIVTLKPNSGIMLDKVHRIDYINNLLYYFIPEGDILNIIEELKNE